MIKKYGIAMAIALAFGALQAEAQLKIGGTAPDFTIPDLKGVPQNLYSYLDKGRPS